MAIITGWTGRKYEVADTDASIVAECKARYTKYAKKADEARNASNAEIEIEGIDWEDAELALELLADFYDKKADKEEKTINAIIDRGVDVTGTR